MALAKELGKCSLVIRAQDRPAEVADAEIILKSIKAILDANRRASLRRANRESQGVRADSIVSIQFELGGEWNGKYGGRVLGYQQFIAQNFPELAAVAGQCIRAA